MELLHQPEDIIAQRYRIIQILGEGGSGTTYLAEDTDKHQLVALKALSLHRLNDWKLMELFEREAKILSQLDHQAIPSYLGYFHTETTLEHCFYIVQAQAPGKSLAASIADGWRTTEDEVRYIAEQILEILVYLHSLNPVVIHRDIKPQNIIRRDDGKVYLVDFGAVQNTYYNTFMRGSTVVGTYGYMAPEQFRGQAVPATDLYGLGATILFLLTHRSPADLPMERLKIDFRHHVQISDEFADWLEKMLEPDMEERFSSAVEALAALSGKQAIAPKVTTPVSWKTIAGVGATIATSTMAIALLNAYKWLVLGAFGIVPLSGTCQNTDAIKDYYHQVHNANALVMESSPYGENERMPLLVCTIRRYNLEGTKFLITQGADVKLPDRHGNTPLHLLFLEPNPYTAQGDYQIAEMLIAKGADINLQNHNGKTPLQLAVQNSQPPIIKLLLQSGGDVNQRDRNGATLLHLAISKTNQPVYGRTNTDTQEIIQLLIKGGANINATDNQGRTPLQLITKNYIDDLKTKKLSSDDQAIADILNKNGAKE
ncbi:protein kinase domain-containing protein [Calothrix sp. 336/3]|uniref:protein kinase domain-containing protein n=1 Tax=Calothrix sp. 336/3 TaxID=1337936 RepID=UPI00062454AF|nr:ankyrin repeat domain-containing protein [Calothrix sp. 336/3]AKG19986.1 hypothetical protein IJ00_00450 [Calothrix sp. 336/3]